MGLLDPWQLPEGSSVKQGLCILHPCCLSGCFLGIGSLDLFDIMYGARDLYEVVRDRAGVFGKNFFLHQKSEKWAKDRPKIEFFEFKEKYEH